MYVTRTMCTEAMTSWGAQSCELSKSNQHPTSINLWDINRIGNLWLVIYLLEDTLKSEHDSQISSGLWVVMKIRTRIQTHSTPTDSWIQMYIHFRHSDGEDGKLIGTVQRDIIYWRILDSNIANAPGFIMDRLPFFWQSRPSLQHIHSQRNLIQTGRSLPQRLSTVQTH
jgi:hypothetical protein